MPHLPRSIITAAALASSQVTPGGSPPIGVLPSPTVGPAPSAAPADRIWLMRHRQCAARLPNSAQYSMAAHRCQPQGRSLRRSPVPTQLAEVPVWPPGWLGTIRWRRLASETCGVSIHGTVRLVLGGTSLRVLSRSNLLIRVDCACRCSGPVTLVRAARLSARQYVIGYSPTGLQHR